MKDFLNSEGILIVIGFPYLCITKPPVQISLRKGNNFKVKYVVCVCVHAKSLQLCPSHCNPMDCSPPGSSVHGILRARIWNGVSFPPPGDLPNPGTELMSLMSPALAGRFFTTSTTFNGL